MRTSSIANLQHNQSGSIGGHLPRTTLTSAGSIRFLHEVDGGSLNFSNTTSVRGSQAMEASTSQAATGTVIISQAPPANQLFAPSPLVSGIEGN